MGKLPKEIKLRTANLPSVVRVWMHEYMEWHGLKGSNFLQHITVDYWEKLVRGEVQKVELVNSVPKTHQKSLTSPKTHQKSLTSPNIPSEHQATTVDSDDGLGQLSTENFF